MVHSSYHRVYLFVKRWLILYISRGQLISLAGLASLRNYPVKPIIYCFPSQMVARMVNITLTNKHQKRLFVQLLCFSERSDMSRKNLIYLTVVLSICSLQHILFVFSFTGLTEANYHFYTLGSIFHRTTYSCVCFVIRGWMLFTRYNWLIKSGLIQIMFMVHRYHCLYRCRIVFTSLRGLRLYAIMYLGVHDCFLFAG